VAHLPKKTAVSYIKFRGSSLKDLCEFPKDARREAGYQLRLDRVKNGLDPEDFKPMSDVGSMPIRLRHTPTTGWVCPFSRVKLFEGWGNNIARDSEQRTKSVERIEPTIEAKREFVKIGL